MDVGNLISEEGSITRQENEDDVDVDNISAKGAKKESITIPENERNL